MFQCVKRSDIGSVFVVTHDNTSPPQLLGTHASVVLRSAIVRLPFTSSHYSAPYNLYKLNMLNNLPTHLSAIVLVDSDVIFSPPFVRTALQYLRTSNATVVASRSSAGGTFHGVQSGVMAFDLKRLRALSPPWWSIFPKTLALPTAEQNLWEWEVTQPHSMLRYFPCGFHLETQLLQATLVDLGLNASEFPARVRCKNANRVRPMIAHGAAGMHSTLSAVVHRLDGFCKSSTARAGPQNSMARGRMP